MGVVQQLLESSVRLCILGTGNLNRIVSIVCSGSGVGFWEGGGTTCIEQALTIASHQIMPSLEQKLSCRQKKDNCAMLEGAWGWANDVLKLQNRIHKS